MALTDNPFIGLPLATLQELQQLAVQTLANIMKTGQSYSFPGLSRTNLNAQDMMAVLSQLRIAIGATAGGTGAGSIKQVANAIIDTQNKFCP
jgi:Tfp pilus assembly protein PilN